MTVRDKTTFFDSEAGVLAEFGERLVSRPAIALAELVKNSYDADASTCRVVFDADARTLRISDTGSGMDEAAFLKGWMRIGTSWKRDRAHSPRYHRILAGSKGIGRFATRRLGSGLKLVTTCKKRGSKRAAYTTICAYFPWLEFRSGRALKDVEINYTVESLATATAGTTLVVSGLRDDVTAHELIAMKSELLGIINPTAFDWVQKSRLGEKPNDPGFTIEFGDERSLESIDRSILDRDVARVRFRIDSKGRARFTIEIRASGEKYEETASTGCAALRGTRAEIRYYPKRPGVFAGVPGVDGRNARRWISTQGGVQVFDRGFRMPPFGADDDDWLGLTRSRARRDRSWKSAIMERLYPKASLSATENENPFLYLPGGHQLFGVVSVQSDPEGEGLSSAMDREGFVENETFAALKDVTRAAVELLGYYDLAAVIRARRRTAKKETSEAQRQLRKAAKAIRLDASLPPKAREKLAERVEDAAAAVANASDAARNADQVLDVLALGGALTAFVTHEMGEVLRAIESFLSHARANQPGTAEAKIATEKLRAQLAFAKSFVGDIRANVVKPRSVRGAVMQVRKQLLPYAEERDVTIDVAVPRGLETPAISAATYTGILLNLGTNALKAVSQVSPRGNGRKIQFSARDEGSHHVIDVSDTGPGVPDELRPWIWNPLFSTTQDEILTAGLGMGLYIVRRAARSVKGTVDLAEPADGFETTFRLKVPIDA